MKFKSIILALSAWALSTTANAAVVFSDGFSGYGDLTNTPPPGWSNYNAGGLGVDSSVSAWWSSQGNTTGISPEGDDNYVIAEGNPSLTEGMAITVNGFTSGQEYSISFYNASSIGATGSNDTYWDVFIDNIFIGSSAVASITTLQWESNNLFFTATNTSHQIGLRGAMVNTSGLGRALLDTVVVSNVVPVPAAVWLFSSGIIGMIAVARRKA